MTNELQVFNHERFGTLESIMIDGKPYFPATKSAEMLEYSNPRDAISRHTKGVVKRDVLTKGGMQEMAFISQGDLLRLITHSKMPAAVEFEVWVFDVVVPTVLRTGMYATDALLSNPDLLIAIAQTLKEERAMRLEAEQEVTALEIKLGESKDWLTVKRVAALNKRHWKSLNYRALINTSKAMGLEIHKEFDANYGSVNAYHVDAWRHEYGDLKYA